MILSTQGDLSRQSATADSWGRYYTADWICKGLVSEMHTSPPKVILELGSGRGALATAASIKWRNAQVITVDMDHSAQSFLGALAKRKFIAHKHHVHDVLDDNLANQIGLTLGSVDLAVCNPPYVRPRWRASFGRILEDAGFSSSLKSMHDAGADLLFIAQNLRLLRKNGKLGLVLPDGLITAEKYAGVRRTLLKEHLVEQVLQLPRRVFAGTEAQTYLLVLAKNGGATDSVQLRQIYLDGSVSPSLLISSDLAQRRLDYAYHASNQDRHICREGKLLESIRDMSLGLTRGTVSSHQIPHFDWPIFHLGDFVSSNMVVPKRFSLSRRVLKELPARTKISMPGDLLVARIGRNLHDKVAIVQHGPCIVSDCIFTLRVGDANRKSLLAFLTSKSGRQALEATSHGVGARYLSSSDLLDIEVVS